MNKNSYTLSALLAVGMILFSCQDTFLDAKPDKSLLVPTTLEDFEMLLDNETEVMNRVPALGEMSCDDYYTTDEGWTGLSTAIERNAYIWAKDVYNGEVVGDWETLYKQVLYANVVLEGLEKSSSSEKITAKWRNLKGSALFHRAFAFYHLAQVFTSPYDKATASTTPGIPLRLSADVTGKPYRATLEQTYDQIEDDLLKARPLLPTVAAYKTRPSLSALYAMLARVYLSMEDYERAVAHADSSLLFANKLMDFNSLDPSEYRPVQQLNDEVLFHSIVMPYSYDYSSYTIVDSALYKSFADNDLRKQIYFSDNGGGMINFKGSYGNYYLFGGLATDEIYLIAAECRARFGDTDAAMDRLNTLLEKRWETGTFVAYNARNADEALKIVLEERRKELIFRGLRWMDLRRLNKDVRFAKTLTRAINGQTYTLSPNDPKYVMPIPIQEINTSGIAQNPR